MRGRRGNWRKRREDQPDPARLLTLIRMRELERLFARPPLRQICGTLLKAKPNDRI
jgi:hypothetical protein